MLPTVVTIPTASVPFQGWEALQMTAMPPTRARGADGVDLDTMTLLSVSISVAVAVAVRRGRVAQAATAATVLSWQAVPGA